MTLDCILIDYHQLEALLAVKREGSFEGASRTLRISPIGVSRRVAKLEATLGSRLLDRKPTRPTAAGEAACRYAEQIEALEKMVLDEQYSNALQPANTDTGLKIAINHDSLYSWFNDVLKKRAEGRATHLLDISMIDQDYSIELMKTGEVIAALSGHNQPVHGFKAFHLGCMSYRAVASPGFKQHYLSQGVNAKVMRTVPFMRYSSQDSLVAQWLDQQFGIRAQVSPMRLPSTKAIVDACVSGSGWAMIPEFSARTHLEKGQLVELRPNAPLEKDMYWHVSSALAETIKDVTASIRFSARTHLSQG